MSDLKTRNTLIFLSLSLCAALTNASAADGPIVTDCPGFITDTYTVNPGKLNIEPGYQYASGKNSTNSVTQTLPLLGLRTGLSSKVELDVLWNGWNFDTAKNQPAVTSTADVSIGGKYRLHKSSNYDLTLPGLISLPFGSSASTSNTVDPLLGLLWDYTLSSNASLFGVALASSFKDQGTRTYDAQVATGVSIARTDTPGSFIEVYSVQPFEAKLKDELVIDDGFTDLLSNDVQPDNTGGIGFNSYSNNFVGFGLAFRFNEKIKYRKSKDRFQ